MSSRENSSALSEQRSGQSGELLRHRADVERRLAGDWCGRLQYGEPELTLPEHLAMPTDHGRAAGLGLRLHH